MVGMIAGWLAGLMLMLETGLLNFFGSFVQSAGQESLTLAHQPWVGQALAVTASVSVSIATVIIAYKALTEYILWNEGTSSLDQPGFWKSAARYGIYAAVSPPLAYMTFTWGFGLAGALMLAPVRQAFNLTAAMLNAGFAAGQGVVGFVGSATGLAPIAAGGVVLAPIAAASLVALLPMLVVIAVMLVILAIVTVEIFYRGAELCIYVIAAPIVALGWFNAQGTIWAMWFKSLVILSLSLAVQWLCLKGLIATVFALWATTAGGYIMAMFAALAWGFLALTGPHLMQAWSYRSGFSGGAGTYIGGFFRPGGGHGGIGGGTKV